jgi:carbon-monoxide dehydrogenase medium subunit
MKLPPFELRRPASVAEATRLLAELGDDAVVYCGGTELLLVSKLGFADYPVLVDVKAIDELRGVAVEDGTLRIGAATTHRELERSPVVHAHLGALAAMERHVGNLRVRTTGTLGGNLCFADPHSDPATFLLAVGGEVVCRGGSGAERRIGVAEFVQGPFETLLEPAELLVSVRVPLPEPGTAIAHRKMSFHERPAITVTAAVRVVDGTVRAASIAIGSVARAPVLATDAAERLVGHPAALDEAALAEAGDAAGAAVDPIEDANGSAEYKRHLVAVLTRRCVRAAAEQAA